MLILLITTKQNVKTNYQLVEGFIEPKTYHTPKNFELYEIDNSNNLIHFIFNPPRPLIIANQVEEYILVVASYILNEEEEKSEPQHLETITFRKVAKLLESSNEVLSKDGKLIFTINKPQETYIDNTNLNSENTKDIFYKFGLMAKYPNSYSNIIHTNNISLFNLNQSKNSFDYSQANLGFQPNFKKMANINDVNNINEPIDTNQCSNFNQLKDTIGGFPDNLNLEQFDYGELNEILSDENMKNNVNFNLNLKFTTEEDKTMNSN